ncbi:MAG: hypothetical protein ACHQVS_03985 [Candidatus Babeliales bacterium]
MMSPLHLVCKIAFLIVVLAAINTGLMPLGYDFFRSDFMMTGMGMGWMTAIEYIIGISGAICLVKFIMRLTGQCGCDCKCESR